LTGQRALARAFATLKSQSVTFDSCLVDPAGATAVVRCHGTIQFVRRVGGGAPRIERQQWVFKLRKSGAHWLIDDVRSSQTGNSLDPL
jgi:hypothetical protein